MSHPAIADLRKVWALEEERKRLAQPAIAKFNAGMLTLPEFVAEIQRIVLDEVGWCNPGATFPLATSQAYTRLRESQENQHLPLEDIDNFN